LFYLSVSRPITPAQPSTSQEWLNITVFILAYSSAIEKFAWKRKLDFKADANSYMAHRIYNPKFPMTQAQETTAKREEFVPQCVNSQLMRPGR